MNRLYIATWFGILLPIVLLGFALWNREKMSRTIAILVGVFLIVICSHEFVTAYMVRIASDAAMALPVDSIEDVGRDGVIEKLGPFLTAYYLYWYFLAVQIVTLLIYFVFVIRGRKSINEV